MTSVFLGSGIALVALYGVFFLVTSLEFGAVDLAFVECGQYNENWFAIHMMPEESVQAVLDVQAKAMVPIHWGAFALALHPWGELVERALKAASEKKIALLTPLLGETVEHIDDGSSHQERWWSNVDSQKVSH